MILDVLYPRSNAEKYSQLKSQNTTLSFQFRALRAPPRD